MRPCVWHSHSSRCSHSLRSPQLRATPPKLTEELTRMLRFTSPSRLKNYSSAPIAGHQEILGRTSCLHAIRILFPLHVLLPSLKLLSTIHTWSVCLAGGNSGNPAGAFGLSSPPPSMRVSLSSLLLLVKRATIDCLTSVSTARSNRLCYPSGVQHGLSARSTHGRGVWLGGRSVERQKSSPE